MKIEKMRRRGQGSLYSSFMRMTLLPLMVLGMIIIIYSTVAFTRGMQSQVQQDLQDVGSAALIAYDVAYPGEYDIIVEGEDKMALTKGGEVISGQYHIMDRLKQDTGVDITIFFYDVRMLTTIIDEEANRYIGTAAHLLVSKKMWEDQSACFYDNVQVGNKDYYAYYGPIMNDDGECIGMIATATPAEDVKSLIYGTVFSNIAITLLALLITAYIIVKFSTKTMMAIKKIMELLREMDRENLSTDIDPIVIQRDDELGDIGRFTVHVQNSLRKVIERDPLTGLYNRRAGSKKIDAAREKAERNGKPYTIAMGDIDFFKRVNDTYGHEAGDVVLKTVASILSEGMVSRGYVIRWGGEEFLFVFERKDAPTAAVILEDILKKIRETVVEYNDQEIRFTMSFGVAVCDTKGIVGEQINEADVKLYYAKEHGRNQVVLSVEAEESPEVVEEPESEERLEAVEEPKAEESPEVVETTEDEIE